MQLNHVIVYCSNRLRSSAFLTDILGRPAAVRFGPFHAVSLDNGVSLDYLETDQDICPQHYAFLVTEDEFDASLETIKAKGQKFWADPGQTRQGRINRNDGGRGVYFEDPDGHLLEILTVPYGGVSGR